MSCWLEVICSDRGGSRTKIVAIKNIKKCSEIKRLKSTFKRAFDGPTLNQSGINMLNWRFRLRSKERTNTKRIYFIYHFQLFKSLFFFNFGLLFVFCKWRVRKQMYRPLLRLQEISMQCSARERWVFTKKFVYCFGSSLTTFNNYQQRSGLNDNFTVFQYVYSIHLGPVCLSNLSGYWFQISLV